MSADRQEPQKPSPELSEEIETLIATHVTPSKRERLRTLIRQALAGAR